MSLPKRGSCWMDQQFYDLMACDSQEMFNFQSYSYGRVQTYFYFGETSHHTIGSNSCPISFSQKLSEVGLWLEKATHFPWSKYAIYHIKRYFWRGSDKADPQIKYWSKMIPRDIMFFSVSSIHNKHQYRKLPILINKDLFPLIFSYLWPFDLS